jgi:hypothetical protein
VTTAPPPAPVAYAPVYQQRTNGFAIAALVLGVASAMCFGLLFVLPLLAIIFGHVALDRIALAQGSEKGRGLAVAGAVLGWVFLVPIVLISFAWLGYGISNH